MLRNNQYLIDFLFGKSLHPRLITREYGRNSRNRCIGAFFVAALTVPAGFGLSTMLTPFALLLMPPHEAVAVVAASPWSTQRRKMLEYVGFCGFNRFQALWNMVSYWCSIRSHFTE